MCMIACEIFVYSSSIKLLTMHFDFRGLSLFSPGVFNIQDVSKKDEIQIQQGVTHHTLNLTIYFFNIKKEELLAFQ